MICSKMFGNVPLKMILQKLLREFSHDFFSIGIIQSNIVCWHIQTPKRHGLNHFNFTERERGATIIIWIQPKQEKEVNNVCDKLLMV